MFYPRECSQWQNSAKWSRTWGHGFQVGSGYTYVDLRDCDSLTSVHEVLEFIRWD
jgi:hypothetical protein